MYVKDADLPKAAKILLYLPVLIASQSRSKQRTTSLNNLPVLFPTSALFLRAPAR